LLKPFYRESPLRKTTIAIAVAASLLTSAVNAQDDCASIPDRDTIPFDDEPSIAIEETWYPALRQACFRIFPLTQISIEPPNLCVSVDKNEKPKIIATFEDGSTYDFGDDYTSKSLRPILDDRFQACRGPHA
jgi:hypothetical protein